jgi:hypothetical protein
MLSISKNANVNYLAKVVKLKTLRKHSNADRLQIAVVDFQTVITDLSAKIDDVYVYFPIECEINKDFLSFINGFRDKELNKDPEQAGFFESNCRVKAMKLRGEKSMGFILPVHKLSEFAGCSITDVDKEFDSINGIQICKKYVPKIKRTPGQPGSGKHQKKLRRSRIIEELIKLHVDTENLRKNIHKLDPNDEISISYKMHGTSWWVTHTKVLRKLKLYEKLLKKFGVKIDEIEDDYIYGSRNVIKNMYEEDSGNHFYKVNLWEEIKNELIGKIPHGFTVYGEAVGFTSNNESIQKGYDYGCKPGEKKIFIYRVTFTNDKGYQFNLSTRAVIDFCNQYGMLHVPYFYIGKVKDLFPDIPTDTHWHENVMKLLEERFEIEKDCHICNNKVPKEGIVIRKENQFNFDVYKLK